MLDRIPFKGVVVETMKVGSMRTVSSVAEAAQMLVTDWPISEGEKLTAARKACLKALEGKIKGEKARTAFIEAAREANILIENSTWVRN